MTVWMFVRTYARNVLGSLDRFGNSLLGGDPRETISSRLGKRLHIDHANCFVCSTVCGFLNFINRVVGSNYDHCLEAIDETVGDRAVIKD
jgi:hypothetical protein